MGGIHKLAHNKARLIAATGLVVLLGMMLIAGNHNSGSSSAKRKSANKQLKEQQAKDNKSGAKNSASKDAAKGTPKTAAEVRKDRLSNRAELAKERIKIAVETKRLTSTQASALTSKVDELLAFQISLLTKSSADRKVARAQMKQEVTVWTKKYDVDESYLRYVL